MLALRLLLTAMGLLLGSNCVGGVSAVSAASAAVTESADSTTLTKRWTLYHSLDRNDDKWTKRGAVSLDIVTDSDDDLKPEDAIQLKIENNDAASKFLKWNQKASWYQLKLVDDDNKENAVVTTVSACQVQRANFRDELVLTFGRQGHVVSLAYLPLVSPLASPGCAASNNKEGKFTSRIRYETAIPGMMLRTVLPSYQPPPGLKFISAKDSNRVSAQATQDAASPDGKPNPNQKPGVLNNDEDGPNGKQGEEEPMDNSPFGLFKRYWYIIVPALLMNFFSAPPEEEPKQQGQEGPQTAQGQGGGGQGGGGQAQAQGSAAATSAQPAARAGKRRGKRSN